MADDLASTGEGHRAYWPRSRGRGRSGGGAFRRLLLTAQALLLRVLGLLQELRLGPAVGGGPRLHAVEEALVDDGLEVVGLELQRLVDVLHALVRVRVLLLVREQRITSRPCPSRSCATFW